MKNSLEFVFTYANISTRVRLCVREAFNPGMFVGGSHGLCFMKTTPQVTVMRTLDMHHIEFL